VNRRERIEELLADVEPVLQELRDEAMKEIGAAQERADANVARLLGACRELFTVEERIRALTEEREGLPSRAYRAGLDGDARMEEELTERYRNLRPALDSLEDRRGSLKEEVARLAPRATGHPNDGTIEQYAGVARVAGAARSELEGLRDRLTKALDAMVGPVASVHDNTRATVQQLGKDREWDQSPVWRGGMRT
jgi:hypothetical protein